MPGRVPRPPILRRTALPALRTRVRRPRPRRQSLDPGSVRTLTQPGRSVVDEALARTARLLPGWTDRRHREQEAAVPEALDVLRATIAAGVSPARALQAAAEATPLQLAPVLTEAVRSAELGANAGRALADAGHRWRLTDMVLAGEALDLAEATGAPAGRVLAGVTAAARDRVRGRQARLAATAEARLSARVVAGMAPGFLVVLTLTAPADAAFLVKSPAGWATVAAAAAFEALGAWWASRIVAGNAVTADSPWGRAGLTRPAERPSRPSRRSPAPLAGRWSTPAGSESGPAGAGGRARTAATVHLSGASSPSWPGPPISNEPAGTAGQFSGAGRRLTASNGASLRRARARTARGWSLRPRRAPARGPLLAAGVFLVAGLGLVVGPALPLALSFASGCALVLVRRARHRGAARRQAALADAAPTVIDLLAACLLAGLNPYLALQRVAERSPEALRSELARVAVELELGQTPSGALRAAADRTGLDELRAAAGVLGAAERWGAPPAEALAARAEALRTRARLQAEAEAGRAAVRLAFPLVFCFLPAFALLVVVPTLAGALHTLVP
jgi:Flp pilus assembly protein TadB